MRIQHNIMAMNAYRNYNLNNKALSGNLEKLSSGYKINRAGDDAAGLAISEKMRAQITGLDAAQKNVKDGISLVKTAEGAMQEIQDMLNRMDYLATQSANGTYDDEVDRANLQKEVDALKSEINRIADSANFNGIKLLDGSRDPNASKNISSAVSGAQKMLDAANVAVNEAEAEVAAAQKKLDNVANLTENRAMTSAEMKSAGLFLTHSPTANMATTATVGTKTFTQVQATGDDGLKFEVSLDGISHVLKDAANSTAVAITLQIGTKEITLTEKDLADAAGTTANGDTVTTKQIADAIEAKLNGNGITVSIDSKTVTFDDVSVDSEGRLLFKASTSPASVVTPSLDIKWEGMAADKIDATGNKYAQEFAVSGALVADSATVTVQYKDAAGQNQTLTVTANIGASVTGSGVVTAIKTELDKDANFSKLFNVTVSAGEISFETKKKGAGVTADITSLTVAASNNTTTNTIAATGTATDTAGTDLIKTGSTGYQNWAAQLTQSNSIPNGDQLASSGLDLTKLDLQDGMRIKVGDKTVTLAIGKDSDYKDAENAVDLTMYEKTDLIKTNGTANTAQQTAAAKIANALGQDDAGRNGIFSVGANSAGVITFKQLSAASATNTMFTEDDIYKHVTVETSVKASEETIAAETTKRTNALNDAKSALEAAKTAQTKAQENLAAAKGNVDKYKDSSALKLQIGDTADPFNQLDVEIGDMHASAMHACKRDDNGKVVTDAMGKVVYDTAKPSIADIDIGSQKGAAEAVQTIKDAINYVSGIRGDLGAVQNRLDHTANNLSVMAENIQDAESTIRDTDVADEMMKYVKNNILVQSAQAMLAQANQVPQGVLQLLG